jgi:hypothetical protein
LLFLKALPLRWLLITSFVLLLVALPVGIALWQQGEVRHWSEARWDSARLAPDPAETPEAVVQVYCAASWGLKGVLADHCWIAFKGEGEAAYTRYDVVRWGVSRGAEAIRVNFRGVPDGNWAGNRPRLLLDRRGAEAAALIPGIERAVAAYPYRHTYRTWPGPNSNTFIGWIARAVPELRLDLPPRAIGKDFIGARLLARAPSNTGYQLSLGGVFSLIVARVEGLELNLSGVTLGVNPLDLSITVPGLGRLRLIGD